ncbi:hypothetical protein V865_002226 [Kwoniella europaea PYCC6329]|uniref:Uncharacterized protein n=1 Tax=Kwoniella europaea PYCC6329 TaxID=1423913 RepID=A0AAX4KCQ7_9TREE
MLKRCSDLASSCDDKDEQMKQITAFLAQAKDLVRGAEQILEGPRNCNTSDSSSSADQCQLHHPAISPRSPGGKDISEVEDATSIQPPGPTSPPIKTNERENPVDDGFLFHPIQQVAWDNPELTSTDHLTPHLPRFWNTAFEGLESWRNGLYSGEIIQRVLLTSLSIDRLQRHPDLAECFFYWGWSGCNFRARRAISVPPNLSQPLTMQTFGLSSYEYSKGWSSSLNLLGDAIFDDPTSTTHFGPATEQEKWDNFQLCRGASAWIVEHEEEGSKIYRKEGKD